MTSTMSTSSAGVGPAASPLKAALYGGIATGLIGAAFMMLLSAKLPILYGLAFVLIGAGPVLGYQLAAGKLGQDWKTLIGGIIGFILPLLSPIIIWPLLVWAFNRSFGLGRIWLGSLLGFILGVAGFFLLGLMIGQDPAWVSFGWAILWALWGGTSAAFMASAVRE